jgi:type III pantothenate kinase
MLTADIGNTRIKWAVWHDRRIIRSGCCAYSKQEPARAFAAWHDMQPEKNVMVACVAGAEVEQALIQWMHSHWSVEPGFLRSTAQLLGVTNAYIDPSQYGADRWAALIAAHQLYRDPVCIIDAGTAVTVDLMDTKGRHKGGRILPGLQMMRESLLKHTEGIRQTDGRLTDFADNTADAVSSGTLHMLMAAVIEIRDAAVRCLGNDMKIIITGGMSEQIMSLPGMPEMLHEPDLVLKGLYAVAQTGDAGS